MTSSYLRLAIFAITVSADDPGDYGAMLSSKFCLKWIPQTVELSVIWDAVTHVASLY